MFSEEEIKGYEEIKNKIVSIESSTREEDLKLSRKFMGGLALYLSTLCNLCNTQEEQEEALDKFTSVVKFFMELLRKGEK